MYCVKSEVDEVKNSSEYRMAKSIYGTTYTDKILDDAADEARKSWYSIWGIMIGASVVTIPITKNSTSRAQPMAWSAPLIPWMTVQTPPPLNSSGVVLRSCQISASFPFQVPRAEFRLSTIQFPLPISITSIHSEFVLIFTPNSAILLAEGGGVDAKYSSYFRFAQ